MAITHSSTIKQGIADYVVDAIDSGSVYSTGKILFKNSEGEVLVELDFSSPAFGDATSAGIATANTISDGTVSAAGTISTFAIVDKDRNTVLNGTVSTATDGTGDISLLEDSLVVSVNQTIRASILKYNSPS